MNEWRQKSFNKTDKRIEVARRRVFLILIGGPGLYNSEDTEHDTVWYSYIQPIFSAIKTNNLGTDAEDVHICLVTPPYADRWADDVANERSVSIVEGAKNYVDHVRIKCSGYDKSNKGYSVKYYQISTGADFWAHLGSLPDATVTRVWYFGHAKKDLWFRIRRWFGLTFSPSDDETVEISDISAHAAHASKFVKKSGLSSKFYGCNTVDFAQKWANTFGVTAEGARGRISFATPGFKEIESSAKQEGGQWVVCKPAS
ncbi:hypothetical protein ACNOYE_39560 [Nannocystaceae bacterium ST9]